MSARRNRGFALLSAVFLVVVLAVLGAGLVNLTLVQHATYTQQLEGARADYAARAGLEWATARAIAGGCTAGTTSFVIDAQMEVAVSCASAVHELPAGLSIYTVIDADGHSLGGYGSGDYASRRMRGKVLVPP